MGKKGITTFKDGNIAYVGFVGRAEEFNNSTCNRLNVAAKRLKENGFEVQRFYGAQKNAPPAELPRHLHSKFNSKNLAFSVRQFTDNKGDSNSAYSFEWKAPGYK